VLLIDERPEEVTDFRRTLAAYEERLAADLAWAQNAATDLGLHGPTNPQPADQVASGTPAPPVLQGNTPLVGGFGVQHVSPRCTIVASSNDHGTEKHVEVALKAAEYGKRRVELGKHVVILLDSLTRLGRAFNQSRKHASSGRIMTGGLDSKALEVPRQIFGSARNTEEAGSLTIIASCLVDTGSAADQIIFEEFKGSGNMELILDRKIAERRLFPAINLAESGTRKEEKMMSEAEVKTMTALRRRLLQMPPHMQVEQLLAALGRFPTNASLVGGAS
jgi:transcription termination factor Rho